MKILKLPSPNLILQKAYYPLLYTLSLDVNFSQDSPVHYAYSSSRFLSVQHRRIVEMIENTGEWAP